MCSTVTDHFFSWRLEVRASVIHYQGMQGECFQDERRETIWRILLYHSQLACRLLPNAGYCLPSWSTSEHCSTVLFSAPWQDDYNVKSRCVTSMPGVRCSSSAFITLGMREWWREGLELLRFSNSRSAWIAGLYLLKALAYCVCHFLCFTNKKTIGTKLAKIKCSLLGISKAKLALLRG